MADPVFIELTQFDGEYLTVNLANLAALRAEPFAHPNSPDWYSMTTLLLADGSRRYVRQSIESVLGTLSRQVAVLTAARTTIEELAAVSRNGWPMNTPWDAAPPPDELTAGVLAVDELLSSRFPSKQARTEVVFTWLKQHSDLLAETAPNAP